MVGAGLDSADGSGDAEAAGVAPLFSAKASSISFEKSSTAPCRPSLNEMVCMVSSSNFLPFKTNVGVELALIACPAATSLLMASLTAKDL